MSCKYCGHELSADDRFCNQCGKPVETEAVTNTENGAETEQNADSAPTAQSTPVKETVVMPQQQTQAQEPQQTQYAAQYTQPAQFAQTAAKRPVPEVFEPARLKALALCGAIGVASALVVTLATLILLALVGLVSGASASSASSASSSALSSLGNLPINIDSNANVLSLFGLLFVGGVGGSVHISGSGTGGFGNATVAMPVMLSGLFLMLGSAFAAFMLSKGLKRVQKWTNLWASMLTGVAVGVVYLIIAALTSVHISSSAGSDSVADELTEAFGQSISSVAVHISGVTAGTFLMAFVLTAVGMWAGLSLSEKFAGDKTVFTAAWKWAHRARGFVRTIVESSAIYAVVFTVVTLIVLALASVGYKSIAPILLFPVVLPTLSAWMQAISSFGSILGSGVGTGSTESLSLFDTTTSSPLLWVIFVVFVLASAYIMLRMIVRNSYDPQFANWKSSWQAPVAVGVAWIVFSFVGLRLTVAMSASGMGSTNVSLNIAPWYGIIAALWMFALEAGARTLSKPLFPVVRSLWRALVGGAVVVDAAEAVAQQDQMQPQMQQTQSFEEANSGATAANLSSDVQPTVVMETAENADLNETVPLAPVANTASEQFIPQNAMPQNPAGMPAQPVQTSQPSQPLSPKAKRGIIIGAIAAAVVVALVVAFNVVSTTVFSAKAAAQAYVTAVEKGEYDKATEMSNLGLTSKQSVLLTSAVGKKSKARITGATLGNEYKGTDNSRTYEVTYNFQGKSRSDTVTVKPVGKRYGVFTEWKVVGGLIQDLYLDVDEAIDGVYVNGVKVELGGKEKIDFYEHAYKVYPGVYDVTTKGSKYIQETSTQVLSNDTAVVRAKATDQLKKDISSKLNAKIDECAKSTDAEPEGCPFDSYIDDDSDRYQNFSWSISKYPSIRNIDLSDGTFYASGGEAKLSYQYKSFFDDSWEDDTSENIIYGYGKFTLKGDDLKISLDED